MTRPDPNALNALATLDRFAFWKITSRVADGRRVVEVEVRSGVYPNRTINRASSRSLFDAIRSAVDKADNKRPQGRGPKLRLAGSDETETPSDS